MENLSVEIRENEILCIVGESGSGKSITSFAAMGLLPKALKPSAGEIWFEGKDLLKLSPREHMQLRGNRMGMIFQEYALVERLTVMENVLSGRLGYVPFWRSFFRRYPADYVANAFALLDRVGLMAHADKRADALSGGQRQRVGIARALGQDPELLLIDEPTASLDPKTSRQIMRLIVEVCRERGLPAIINIHDVLLAQAFVERIIGLRAGEVVFDGPPEALDTAALTRIYGEEDWEAMRKQASDDADEEREAAIERTRSEERMAGIA
ncbi:MAG: phosphonate ABC transporter ATP-binding protein [Rhodocyclaceae bacterium]